jgi:hypothetical protein
MSSLSSFLLFSLVYLAGFVTKLLKTLDEGTGCRLVGIIGDGNELIGDIGLNFLDTILKSQVALDCLLATLTVHLWQRGDNEGFDVLCLCGNDHHKHNECE